jgi:hypothetical protein
MAHYGIYVGDQGGPNSYVFESLEFESGETYAAYGAPQPVSEVAAAAGLPFNSGLSAYGGYIFDFSGVDYAHHLHVIDPCTAQGTCP